MGLIWGRDKGNLLPIMNILPENITSASVEDHSRAENWDRNDQADREISAASIYAQGGLSRLQTYAANISYNLLKTAAGNGVAIGPLLLGVAKPIHILTPAATVRRIINVSTLAVVEAASQSKGLF